MLGVKPSLRDLSINSIAHVFSFLTLTDAMAVAATQSHMKAIILNRENRCSSRWTFRIRFRIYCGSKTPYTICFDHDSFCVDLSSFGPDATSKYLNSEHYKFLVAVGQLTDDIIIHLSNELVFAWALNSSHYQFLYEVDSTPHHVVLHAPKSPLQAFCSPIYTWQNVELIEFNWNAWNQHRAFLLESFPNASRFSYYGTIHGWMEVSLETMLTKKSFHNVELTYPEPRICDVMSKNLCDFVWLRESYTNASATINILDTPAQNLLLLKLTHWTNNDFSPILLRPIRHLVLSWMFIPDDDARWNYHWTRTDCPWSFCRGIKTAVLNLFNVSARSCTTNERLSKMLMLVVFPVLVDLSHQSSLRRVELVFGGSPLEVSKENLNCSHLIPKSWIVEFFERNRIGNGLNGIVLTRFNWESSAHGRPGLTTQYITNTLKQRFRLKFSS